MHYEYARKFPYIDFLNRFLIALAPRTPPLFIVVKDFFFGKFFNTLLQRWLLDQIVWNRYTKVHEGVKLERNEVAFHALEC